MTYHEWVVRKNEDILLTFLKTGIATHTHYTEGQTRMSIESGPGTKNVVNSGNLVLSAMAQISERTRLRPIGLSCDNIPCGG